MKVGVGQLPGTGTRSTCSFIEETAMKCGPSKKWIVMMILLVLLTLLESKILRPACQNWCQFTFFFPIDFVVITSLSVFRLECEMVPIFPSVCWSFFSSSQLSMVSSSFCPKLRQEQTQAKKDVRCSSFLLRCYAHGRGLHPTPFSPRASTFKALSVHFCPSPSTAHLPLPNNLTRTLFFLSSARLSTPGGGKQ